MNTLRRIVRTTTICRASIRAQRLDPLPLTAFCIIIMMLGDDLVLWVGARVSPTLTVRVEAWGGGLTTLAFGVLPALALAGMVLRVEWRESWRATANHKKTHEMP